MIEDRKTKCFAYPMPLIIAGCISVMMLIAGAFTLSFFSDPNNGSFFAKLIWLAPMSALPLFLLLFISRKAHVFAMWAVSIATYCGGFASMQQECMRGACIQVNSAIGTFGMVAIGALVAPPVILAVVNAVLVQYSYKLLRKRMKDDVCTCP